MSSENDLERLLATWVLDERGVKRVRLLIRQEAKRYGLKPRLKEIRQLSRCVSHYIEGLGPRSIRWLIAEVLNPDNYVVRRSASEMYLIIHQDKRYVLRPATIVRHYIGVPVQIVINREEMVLFGETGCRVRVREGALMPGTGRPNKVAPIMMRDLFGAGKAKLTRRGRDEKVWPPPNAL